ncbi:DNA polymerase III subunit beta [Micromonospora sp. NPDC049366]|uniref:DNA polymerase III subunit beta n=1 Tax=Micromonospora sp. NPDC049366 TaxID=3364271 RepID=UPI003795C84E
MKFKVNPKDLGDAVAWTAKSLPARPAIPVLAGLMLRVDGGRLTLSAFDYEASNEVALEVDGASDGAALVSGRLLSEIVKALPAKTVEIASAGAHLELVCGSARFSLPTMPAEDYPQLPAMPPSSGTVAAAEFATAVAQVAIAAGRDDTLPLLTGIRIEVAGDVLTMLGTDRYRLALREMRWTPADPDASLNLLVPAKNLHDSAKSLGPVGGDVHLALTGSGNGEGMVGLVAGTRRTTSRLLDGANYPPVRSLFPSSFKAEARVNVAALTEVVKRIALVAERATPVLLDFTADTLIVSAGGPEEARGSEAMDATFTGEPLTAAFNPQYLLDGLSQLGAPTAAFWFVDANKPAVIEPADGGGNVLPGYRYLIMPIRIR